MCPSPGATSVCMATEPLSVIVQRRSLDRNLADHARLMNKTRYMRLGDPQKYGGMQRSTVVVPSLKVKNNQEKPSQLVASSLAVKDQLFQVK